jgi:hypothetical protein
MKKRVTALSLVVTTAAVGTGIAVAATRPGAAPSAGSQLHTTAKLTFAHSVDLGRHGPSAGDITTFGGRLVGPDLKGRYQASCVTISSTRQECSETLTMPDGQIAAQASYGQGSTAVTPIIGGSGNYAGARGDISEQEVANGREVKLVFHLEK